MSVFLAVATVEAGGQPGAEAWLTFAGVLGAQVVAGGFMAWTARANARKGAQDGVGVLTAQVEALQRAMEDGFRAQSLTLTSLVDGARSQAGELAEVREQVRRQDERVDALVVALPISGDAVRERPAARPGRQWGPADTVPGAVPAAGS